MKITRLFVIGVYFIGFGSGVVIGGLIVSQNPRISLLLSGYLILVPGLVLVVLDSILKIIKSKRK